MQVLDHDEDEELSLWSSIDVCEDYFILRLPDFPEFHFKYEYLDLLLDYPEKLNDIGLTEDQKDFWSKILPEVASIVDEKYELYQDMGFKLI